MALIKSVVWNDNNAFFGIRAAIGCDVKVGNAWPLICTLARECNCKWKSETWVWWLKPGILQAWQHGRVTQVWLKLRSESLRATSALCLNPKSQTQHVQSANRHLLNVAATSSLRKRTNLLKQQQQQSSPELLHSLHCFMQTNFAS